MAIGTGAATVGISCGSGIKGAEGSAGAASGSHCGCIVGANKLGGVGELQAPDAIGVCAARTAAVGMSCGVGAGHGGLVGAALGPGA